MKHRLTYPLTSPSALNPDARVLYSTRTDYDGRLYWGDPFATAEETKVDTREQREVYRPTERFLAAADELEAHRLGSYDRELEQLHRTRVHPLYTVARGSGMYFASVSLVRTDHVRSQYPSHVHRPSVHDELLLAPSSVLISTIEALTADGRCGAWKLGTPPPPTFITSARGLA